MLKFFKKKSAISNDVEMKRQIEEAAEYLQFLVEKENLTPFQHHFICVGLLSNIVLNSECEIDETLDSTFDSVRKAVEFSEKRGK